MNDTHIDNIFDEMYLSIENPKRSKTSFGFVNGLGNLISETDRPNYYWSVYSHPNIPIEEFTTVVVKLDEQTVRIGATIEIENGSCIKYDFIYDFKSKSLTSEPISIITHNYKELGVEQFMNDKEQISAFLKEHNITTDFVEQYKNHFLYERVLSDWVTGNGSRSRFSNDNFGNFTIIDNTIVDLGNW